MSVFSDTPSSRTPSPQNLPWPRSKISVVNNRTGFKFQGAEDLPANGSASRLSLIRQKHLSHIGALKEDGYDFVPADFSQALNESLTSSNSSSNPRSQFTFPPPKPQMTWKERLLASASASTLKIKGITKKLKNKVILLRDVVVPSSLNPPPPPTYHSAATPAVPNPFANLPPPTKFEFSSQRIVCIKDLGLALDQEDDEKNGRLFGREDEEDGNVTPRLMSPAWPHRKHLSTLPEESDGLTSHLSDDDDEGPHPDVYVEAVLMPVENLTRGVGKSPARSRVSPPWMHQTLHDASTSTLRLGDRNAPTSPLNAAISPSPSILRFDGFRLSGEDHSLLSPYQNRRQSVMSFLSSTASSYGTNARRRASSLIMLPADQPQAHRSSRASSGRNRSSTFSGPDKENHAGYASATFGKNGPRTKQHSIGEQYEEDTESDDEDEDGGEEQEYYVFEADPRDLDPSSPVKEGSDGKRESVLVLLPVPNADAEAQQAGWPDLKTQLSFSDLGGAATEVSNPFLTPFGYGAGVSLPPSSTYDPSVRDSRYSRGSRRFERDSYITNPTSNAKGGGMGGKLESAWEEEEEEEEDRPVTPKGRQVFLEGKPLPNIPTPSEKGDNMRVMAFDNTSVGSFKTAPTHPTGSRAASNNTVPQLTRKGSSGGQSRNPSLTNLPTIPGASRNNSTTQLPGVRSRTSSGAQPYHNTQFSPKQTLFSPNQIQPPPYNRHGTQVHMPGAFGARSSRSRVHVPQTIEEPEPEELDEIDIDEELEDEEWGLSDEDDVDVDEEALEEIDAEGSEILPRSVVGPRKSKQGLGLTDRPGFVALPVPIPTAKKSRSFLKEKELLGNGTGNDRRERSRTRSRPLPPSRPESTQSPPPPAPMSVPAQVVGAPKPSKPYQGRHILSMKEFDHQLEADNNQELPQKKSTTTTTTKRKSVPRPLSDLGSDIVPAPVPSPSYAPAPLAPPTKPKPIRKNSTSSAGSRRGAAARKRTASQPKPVIVVDEDGVVVGGEELPLSATGVRRNKSQSTQAPGTPTRAPGTPTRPRSSSTFGAPVSPPVRTRSKKARIPIPQALFEGEQVVDIVQQSPRTRVASSPADIVRSASQKSVARERPMVSKAPTRPLPPQPPAPITTNSPKSYPRADVVTPTPSNGSRKNRSSNPSTPKMTYKQGLMDDGMGKAQRKEAEAFMKSSGRAFQGQACSIEVQVVEEGGDEFGRKDGGGGYVDRSGSQRSKRSRRASQQMYGSAVDSSPSLPALPTPKSGHVRLRPSI